MYFNDTSQGGIRDYFKGIKVDFMTNQNINKLCSYQINAIKQKISQTNFFDNDEYQRIKNSFKLPIGTQTGGIFLQNYCTVINQQTIHLLKTLLQKMCLNCGYFIFNRKNVIKSQFINKAIDALTNMDDIEFRNLFINSNQIPVSKQEFKQYVNSQLEKIVQSVNNNDINQCEDVKYDSYEHYLCEQCKMMQEIEIVSCSEVIKRKNYSNYVFNQEFKEQIYYSVYINGEYIFPQHLRILLMKCSKKYIINYLQLDQLFIQNIFIPSLVILNENLQPDKIQPTIDQIRDLCYLSTINIQDMIINPLLFVQSDCQLSTIQEFPQDQSNFLKIFQYVLQQDKYNWFLYICKLYFKDNIPFQFQLKNDLEKDEQYEQFKQILQENQDICKIFINNSIYINILCQVFVGNLQNSLFPQKETIIDLQKNMSSYKYDQHYPLCNKTMNIKFNDINYSYQLSFTGSVIISSTVQYGTVLIGIKDSSNLAVYDYLRNFTQDIAQQLIRNGPNMYPGIIQINDIYLGQFSLQQRHNLAYNVINDKNQKILRHILPGDLVLLRLSSGQSCLLRAQIVNINASIQINPLQFGLNQSTNATLMVIPEYHHRVELEYFKIQQLLRYNVFKDFTFQNIFFYDQNKVLKAIQIISETKQEDFKSMQNIQKLNNKILHNQQNQRQKITFYTESRFQCFQPSILYPKAVYTAQSFLQQGLTTILSTYLNQEEISVLNNQNDETTSEMEQYLAQEHYNKQQFKQNVHKLFQGDTLLLNGDISIKLHAFCQKVEQLLDLKEILYENHISDQKLIFVQNLISYLQKLKFFFSKEQSVELSEKFQQKSQNLGFKAINNPISLYQLKLIQLQNEMAQDKIDNEQYTTQKQLEKLLENSIIQYDGSVRSALNKNIITQQADYLQNTQLTSQDISLTSALIKSQDQRNNCFKCKIYNVFSDLDNLQTLCDEICTQFSSEQYDQFFSKFKRLMNFLSSTQIDSTEIYTLSQYLDQLIQLQAPKNKYTELFRNHEIQKRSTLSKELHEQKRIQIILESIKMQLIQLSQQPFETIINAYKDGSYNYVYIDLQMSEIQDNKVKFCLQSLQKSKLLQQNGNIQYMFNEAFRLLNKRTILFINRLFHQLQYQINVYDTIEFQNELIQVQVEVYERQDELKSFLEKQIQQRSFIEVIKRIKVQKLCKNISQQLEATNKQTKQVFYTHTYMINIEIAPAHLLTGFQVFNFAKKFLKQLQEICINNYQLKKNLNSQLEQKEQYTNTMQFTQQLLNIMGNNTSMLNLDNNQESKPNYVFPVKLLEYQRQQRSIMIKIDAEMPIFISDIEYALSNVQLFHNQQEQDANNEHSSNYDDSFLKTVKLMRKQLRSLLRIVNSAFLDVSDTLHYFGIEAARHVLLDKVYDIVMDIHYDEEKDINKQDYRNTFNLAKESNSQQVPQDSQNSFQEISQVNQSKQQLLDIFQQKTPLDINQKNYIMKLFYILLDAMTSTGQFRINIHDQNRNMDNFIDYLNQNDLSDLFTNNGCIFQVYYEINGYQAQDDAIQEYFKRYFSKQ